MNICINCVQDENLIDKINEINQISKCTLCNSSNRSINLNDFTSIINEVISNNFQKLNIYDKYTDYQINEGKHLLEYSLSEIVGLITEDLVRYDDEIISNVSNELKENFEEGNFYDGEELFYDDDSFYDYREIDDSYHIEEWNYFVNKIKHETRFFLDYTDTILSDIIKYLPNFKKGTNDLIINLKGNKKNIYRARYFKSDKDKNEILNDPIKQLGCVPKIRAKIGRMNPAGISIFYGALDVRTCLDEIKLKPNGKAIIGTFKIIEDLRILDLTKLNEVNHAKVLSYLDNDFYKKVSILKFLSHFESEISKEISKDESELEYIPTQYITELLLTNKEFNLDGILFTSSLTKKENIIIIKSSTISQEDYLNDEEFPYIPVSNVKNKIELDTKELLFAKKTRDKKYVIESIK